MFKFLEGKKTYIAAIGLLGLALYQVTIADYAPAIETFMAALAAFGIRHAMSRKGM